MLSGYDLLQLVLQLVHVLRLAPVCGRRQCLLHPLLPRRRLELLPDLLVVALPANQQIVSVRISQRLPDLTIHNFRIPVPVAR